MNYWVGVLIFWIACFILGFGIGWVIASFIHFDRR